MWLLWGERPSWRGGGGQQSYLILKTPHVGGKDQVGTVTAANSPIPILISANGWKGPSLRGGGSRQFYSTGLVGSMEA
jgi:hypothetical protein